MRSSVKFSLLVSLLAVNFSFAARADDAAERSPYLEQSRNIATEFMQHLAGTLKKQLEAGGADTAISVCQKAAPALAADYSVDGWRVARVSLKPRNKSLGTPDAWEKKELQKFDQAQDPKKLPVAMESASIVEEPGGRWFRYMKAIPVQAQCLQCHGKESELSPKVKAILLKDCPEDRATGYGVGEIRGAVSIKRKLD